MKKPHSTVSDFIDTFILIYGWGSTASRLDHFKEVVYFLALISQKFLVYNHIINLKRMKGWVDLGAT